MKKIFILIIALFLLSGCIEEMKLREETPICESPRIMYEGECCLDTDESGTCDMIEEALKRAEQIEEEEEAEITEEKIADQCVDMSSWITCEDISISYDEIIERGTIKIQLKNNRAGILVIKNFKFPTMPLCDKELSWNRDTTGMLPAESSKYVIECKALKNIDLLDTTIEMDTNYYAQVQGLKPELPLQYMSEVEQKIKGTIKGST